MISYGCTAVGIATPEKKKRSLMPLLTVLFLFSYGLMTLLIVEQGSAIQSQRNLIDVLMRDSRELWATKGKAIVAEHSAATAKAPAAQAPAAGSAGSNENKRTASNKATKHGQGHAGKTAKPDTELPPAPAADLIDHRRALNTI